MRFRLRLPRFATSTVETGPQRPKPVLDGRAVSEANRWNLPPHTVALIGRPAVWFAFDIRTPQFRLGPIPFPSLRLVWEQDFGGHLFLAIADADASRVTLIEAGPANSNGTGALVPYAYPEDDFAARGIVDFEPIVIKPPHGLSEEFFAQLVRDAQRDYDGNQRYRAVEIPFLRVGRDSNSYAIGVLLSCGIDPRDIPKPAKAMRWEWVGYPGAEDPVHRSNFGAYLGAPSHLGDGVIDVAHHGQDGDVRYVVVGGPPHGRARLPDGSEVELDANGRLSFTPEDAKLHGLPSQHTEPPENIRSRRRFPSDPAPAGAEITLVVDGQSVPLEPGNRFRGTIVSRHDAVSLARLQSHDGYVVLPLIELGVEMRDPQRVNRLLRVGTEVTVGLRRDRHPKLDAHGYDWFRDIFAQRRFHLPRSRDVVLAAAVTAGVVLIGSVWFVRER